MMRFLTALCLLGGVAAASDYSWEMAGPGGGGRYIRPKLSADGVRLMCASDMGAGFYGAAADGGMTFIRQADFSFSASNGFIFHPAKNNIVFAAAGRRGAAVSEDSGATWRDLALPVDKIEWNGSWPLPYAGPMALAFDPADPNRALLAYSNYGKKGRNIVCVSADGGRSWRLLRMFPEDSKKFIDAAFSAAGDMLLATEGAVFLLKDGNAEALLEAGPGGAIVAFRRAGNKLYTAVNHPNGAKVMIADAAEFRDWRTVDMGGKKEKITFFAASSTIPETVYFIMPIPGGTVTPDDVRGSTVFKTADGFQSWTPVLFRNRKSAKFNVENPQWTSDAWGWQTPPRGLDVCASNPDLVLATDQTQLYFSKNGGTSWRALGSKGAGTATKSGGMAIMSAYGYYFDPSQRGNRYIAMNDFSNWASFDGGASWAQYNDGNPFAHNVYAARYDERVPGKLWIGASKDHDLPHWKWQNANQKLTNQGGLLLSLDGGKSWRQMGKATLPAGNVTGIDIEPVSRALTVAVFGKGIYRSEDGGETFAEANEGLSKYDRTVFRLRRDAADRLWLVTSVKKPGTVYRSGDQGKSWKKVFSDGKFPFLTDIAFDPVNSETVYLAAFSSRPFHDSDGGVKRSDDGGKTFRTVFPGRACWSVAVHPKRPQTLFACTYSDGIFKSDDGGASWRQLRDYPAPSPIAVTFDPEDPDTLYVSNFGASVYKGTLKK